MQMERRKWSQGGATVPSWLGRHQTERCDACNHARRSRSFRAHAAAKRIKTKLVSALNIFTPKSHRPRSEGVDHEKLALHREIGSQKRYRPRPLSPRSRHPSIVLKYQSSSTHSPCYITFTRNHDTSFRWLGFERRMETFQCFPRSNPRGPPTTLTMTLITGNINQLVYKDTMVSPIAAIVVADYRMSGADELLVIGTNGEVRGYIPTVSSSSGDGLERLSSDKRIQKVSLDTRSVPE